MMVYCTDSVYCLLCLCVELGKIAPNFGDFLKNLDLKMSQFNGAEYMVLFRHLSNNFHHLKCLDSGKAAI